MKILPLQKEWEERKKLRVVGYNLWVKGHKLRYEGEKLWGEKLWDESNKLFDESNKLREEGDNLLVEGRKLWNEAIIKYYGKDAKITWRRWHKDNDPTCHVGSDVYV